MKRTHTIILGLLALALAAGWLLIETAFDPDDRTVAVTGEEEGIGGTGAVGGPAAPVPPVRTPPEDAIVAEDVVYTPRDREIFDETMRWAAEEGLSELELGDIMVRVGRRFVGVPYTPHTLELPGPERVVINLREFDCVTYVESVLALSRLIRESNDSFGAYAEELRRIRYRNGELGEYPSRLHYFSEWIADNEEKGLIRNITREIGGVAADEPIHFMTSHLEAYERLEGRPEWVERIRQIERELSTRPRYYVPERSIAEADDRIQPGDIIAATSSLEGLDIAHTGLAIRIDGALHMMHAPLVGKAVEISRLPLASRILDIEGQDGVMIARPR